MHNFFLHKNILIFRRFFNSANRFNTVYFSAIYFNDHQNLQSLYNTYSNLNNVISDLNAWHDSAPKSLQGFTLNSAYFEFVKQ